MKNLSIRSQNLIMILFLLLINIPALMSIGATDKEWIILISSFVFSMDMIVIPLLFIFFIIYIGDCLEKLWFFNECWHFIHCIAHTISKGCGCFTFAYLFPFMKWLWLSWQSYRQLSHWVWIIPMGRGMDIAFVTLYLAVSIKLKAHLP